MWLDRPGSGLGNRFRSGHWARATVDKTRIVLRFGPMASKFCQIILACVVVLALCWNWSEAFVHSLQRPAGSVVVAEKLPRGLTCRRGIAQIAPDRYARDSPEYEPAEPAIILPYGSSELEEWNPMPQWRGEKTYHPSKDMQDDTFRQWYHFDAEKKTLGHLAKAIALVLQGKESPLYDPIRDVGAYAIVTNCERVRVSGKKYHYKLYLRNVGNRPGNMKVERFKDLQKRFPERIIMRAVWGFMPKTPSSRRIFRERLKLFAGPNHLYYNKDPVEYPMHKIKDCTHTSNLRYRDRTMIYQNNKLEKERLVNEFRQQREDAKRLKAYKRFLSTQLERAGSEADDMAMEDFVNAARDTEYMRVFEETQGQDPNPSKVQRVHYKSWLPKKKYSANRNQRKGVTPVIQKLEWNVEENDKKKS